MFIRKIDLPYRYENNYTHGKENKLFINDQFNESVYPTGLIFRVSNKIYKYKTVERYRNIFIERYFISWTPWVDIRQTTHGLYPVLIKIHDSKGYASNLFNMEGIKNFYALCEQKKFNIYHISQLYQKYVLTDCMDTDPHLGEALYDHVATNRLSSLLTNYCNINKPINMITSDLEDTWMSVTREKIPFSCVTDMFDDYFDPYLGDKHYLDYVTQASFEGMIDSHKTLYPISAPCRNIDFTIIKEENNGMIVMDKSLSESPKITEMINLIMITPLTDYKFKYTLSTKEIEIKYLINRYCKPQLSVDNWLNANKPHLYELSNLFKMKLNKEIMSIEINRTYEDELFISVITPTETFKYHFDLLMISLCSQTLMVY